MKAGVLMGFILGLSVALLMGAAIANNRMEIWGEFVEVGVYKPAFSGITPEGHCYLAVTNTKTGRSEIFGIPKEALERISQKPFQLTEQNSVITELSRR